MIEITGSFEAEILEEVHGDTTISVDATPGQEFVNAAEVYRAYIVTERGLLRVEFTGEFLAQFPLLEDGRVQYVFLVVGEYPTMELVERVK